MIEAKRHWDHGLAVAESEDPTMPKRTQEFDDTKGDVVETDPGDGAEDYAQPDPKTDKVED